jgi:hypothetical protein
MVISRQGGELLADFVPDFRTVFSMELASIALKACPLFPSSLDSSPYQVPVET